MTPATTRGGASLSALLRAAVTAVVLLTAVSACTTPEPEFGTIGDVQPVVPTGAGPGAQRTPPPSLTPVPSAGTVVVEPGPFTDRLQVTGLSILAGGRPAVVGSLTNLTDVSELIVLELRADFYDAAGKYVGSGTTTYADEEFAGNGAAPLAHGTGERRESVDFTVHSDEPITGAASAVLTVPQLVNE